MGRRYDTIAGNEAHSGFIAQKTAQFQPVPCHVTVQRLDGENHLFAAFAVVQAEQFIVIRMQFIAVIIRFVVDDFFKIGNGLAPLPVVKIYLPAQSVGSPFRGTPVIGCFPGYGKFGDGIRQVVENVTADGFCRFARVGQGGEFLFDDTALIVIRYSSPAIEHSEIGHGTQEFGFAYDTCFHCFIDIHGGDIPDDRIRTVYYFVEILPGVLDRSVTG